MPQPVRQVTQTVGASGAVIESVVGGKSSKVPLGKGQRAKGKAEKDPGCAFDGVDSRLRGNDGMAHLVVK